ncbi:MAG TPA: hypothetical protein O0X01_08070 [Methanocorpusculum sp.]|nr:hypothetical protein [Methanocorpusculum sp.]
MLLLHFGDSLFGYAQLHAQISLGHAAQAADLFNLPSQMQTVVVGI